MAEPGSRHEHLAAIRTVLAAYRSTEGHVTKDQITAAWSEYEAAKQALSACTYRSSPPCEHETYSVRCGSCAACRTHEFHGGPGEGVVTPASGSNDSRSEPVGAGLRPMTCTCEPGMACSACDEARPSLDDPA